MCFYHITYFLKCSELVVKLKWFSLGQYLTNVFTVSVAHTHTHTVITIKTLTVKTYFDIRSQITCRRHWGYPKTENKLTRTDYYWALILLSCVTNYNINDSEILRLKHWHYCIVCMSIALHSFNLIQMVPALSPESR